jgi:hypothetical protein
MEYLLDTKLQVKIKESTGEMTGVCVERYWILVDCRVGGNVPKVKPMRFAKGCENVKLRHWALAGNAHVAFDGLT